MGDLELFEPGAQIFTGTVRSLSGIFGELVTDSGLSVVFVVQGQPQPQIGSRITINTRRYRPIYHATSITAG